MRGGDPGLIEGCGASACSVWQCAAVGHWRFAGTRRSANKVRERARTSPPHASSQVLASIAPSVDWLAQQPRAQQLAAHPVAHIVFRGNGAGVCADGALECSWQKPATNPYSGPQRREEAAQRMKIQHACCRARVHTHTDESTADERTCCPLIRLFPCARRKKETAWRAMLRVINYKPRLAAFAATRRLRRLLQTQNRRAAVGCFCSPTTRSIVLVDPCLL